MPRDSSAPDPILLSFRPVPDPTEHLLAHYEADRLDGLHQQGCPPLRVHVSLPDQQPGRPVLSFPEHEGPRGVVGRRGLPHRDPAAASETSGCNFTWSPTAMSCQSETMQFAL